MSTFRQLFTFIFIISLVSFRVMVAQQVEWTSFEHLSDRFQKEQRPVVIFIHTDWCKYCSMQEETTFQDTTLISLLDSVAYALKLNAENQDDILFFNRKYSFEPTGPGIGQHELATFLGSENGKLTFPTTVLLNKRLEVIGRFTGYKDAAFLLTEISMRTTKNSP